VIGFSSSQGRGQQPNSSASSQQLKLLVHQIQMAVQAGYISPQFLQHPLPQQSLLLLNQLLQQIKHFQQLNQAQNQMGKSNSNTALQLSVQITKTKLQINNLHVSINLNGKESRFLGLLVLLYIRVFCIRS